LPIPALHSAPHLFPIFPLCLNYSFFSLCSLPIPSLPRCSSPIFSAPHLFPSFSLILASYIIPPFPCLFLLIPLPLTYSLCSCLFTLFPLLFAYSCSSLCPSPIPYLPSAPNLFPIFPLLLTYSISSLCS
jgi:hypothetical protein